MGELETEAVTAQGLVHLHDVRDFGAQGNGIDSDTVAVQSAIDACFLAGGGQVTIPSGRTFVCGSLRLRSHVELHLEQGSVLAASSLIADFGIRCRTSGLSDGKLSAESENTPIFIAADDEEDISITGNEARPDHPSYLAEASHVAGRLGVNPETQRLRRYWFFVASCVVLLRGGANQGSRCLCAAAQVDHADAGDDGQ